MSVHAHSAPTLAAASTDGKSVSSIDATQSPAFLRQSCVSGGSRADVSAPSLSTVAQDRVMTLQASARSTAFASRLAKAVERALAWRVITRSWATVLKLGALTSA